MFDPVYCRVILVYIRSSVRKYVTLILHTFLHLGHYLEAFYMTNVTRVTSSRIYEYAVDSLRSKFHTYQTVKALHQGTVLDMEKILHGLGS